MSALISDVLCDRVDVRKANAACHAAGMLLRVYELQQRAEALTRGTKAIALVAKKGS